VESAQTYTISSATNSVRVLFAEQHSIFKIRFLFSALIIKFEIPGIPVPFARARSNGSRRFNPKKQADNQRDIEHTALIAMRAARLFAPITGVIAVNMLFEYEYPASWSGIKRLANTHKTSRPDIDNLVKQICDGMTGVVYEDDAQVSEILAKKTYGTASRTTVVVSRPT